MGNPVSGRLEPWGWLPWIMLAHPHKFYHFRLQATATSFLTPYLILSHQDASRHVHRVGGFVEPEMMVITTDGCGTSTHGQTHTAAHGHTRLFAEDKDRELKA